MLFPQPRKLIPGEGLYRIKGNYAACDLFGFFMAVKDGCEDVAVTLSPLLAQEEYRLSIDENGVMISASCEEGVFRAAATLR